MLVRLRLVWLSSGGGRERDVRRLFAAGCSLLAVLIPEEGSGLACKLGPGLELGLGPGLGLWLGWSGLFAADCLLLAVLVGSVEGSGLGCFAAVLGTSGGKICL